MDMPQPIIPRPQATVRRMVFRANPAVRSLSVAIILLIAGQSLLLLLAPLTRAADPLGGSSGIALLAADSNLYLSRSVSLSDIISMPWTRWAYLGVLHAGHVLGDAATFAVLVNVFAVTAAGALLHHLGRRTAGEVAGWIAASVLLLNPMTSQWVRFVLTESLMYTLVIVMLWSSWRLATGRGSGSTWSLLLLAGTLATFLRPNGLLLLGSAVTLAILSAVTIRWRPILLITTWIGVVLGLGAALTVTGQPAEDSFAGQLYAGVVVEGTEHVRVVIAMPEPTDVTDRSELAAIRFGLEHPVATGRLVVARILVESGQVRRHYPLVVNVAFGTATLVLFVSAALGWQHPGALHLRRPIIVLALPLIALVGLTFAVPEGRYGWSYLVLLAPLAGLGVTGVFAGPTAR